MNVVQSFSSAKDRNLKEYPKRPRLRKFDYKGTYAYSITITTNYRKPHFSNREEVSMVLSTLRECCAKYSFCIVVYCFMPDHLHVILQGQSPKSEMKKCIKLFKQKSGYCFKQSRGQNLWQPSYYDHVLRKNEDRLAVARYILFNPVRAGLVKSFRDYPFSGSDLFDLKSASI